MIFYAAIEPTEHYLEHHSDVPWKEVVENITEIKKPRKKENKYQYENKKIYILCEKKDGILFVINAKRK
jgi:hypothetical protein